MPPPPLHIGPVVVDPPVLQAPMAGFTNYAYRQVVREFGGAGLQATEMVCAQGFLGRERAEGELPDRLWGVADEAAAAGRANLGQRSRAAGRGRREAGPRVESQRRRYQLRLPGAHVAERAHSGSYLLNDPQRIGAIVERVVAACAPTPVTAKIRLGCTRDSIRAIEVAQVVESAGGAALTVHGRTAQDFFKGQADWDRIAEIKPHLRRIPLIGNGDLSSPRSVLAAFARYGVDGVMIARAALGKPWLFRQVQAAMRGEEIPPDPTLAEERELLLRHYELVCRRFGVEKGTVLMRKFACCYAQGRRGAREFRAAVARVCTPEEFLNAVESHFPRDLAAATTC